MAVTRDIPLATDRISVSQGQLLANNQGYVDTFAVDHVPYNNSGQGFHNQSTYPVQAVDPVTTSSQGRVYAKQAAAVGSPVQIYYKYQTDPATNLTGQVFPLTCVKAFAKCNVTPGNALIPDTAFNVASVIFNNGTLTWAVTLTTAITDNISKMMVLTAGESLTATGASVTYQLVDLTHINLRINSGGIITGITFMVMAL